MTFTLRQRVAAYVFLNALALLMVVTIGIRLTRQVENQVTERMRLVDEYRGVVRIRKMTAEAVQIAEANVFDPRPADMGRYSALISSAEQEAAALAELPVSGDTRKSLQSWGKELAQFDVRVRWAAGCSGADGVSVRQTLRELRNHADAHTRTLQELADRLNGQLESGCTDLRSLLESSTYRMTALCLLPCVIIVFLLITFTSSLGKQVSQLEEGFARLADGEFSFRIANRSRGWNEPLFTVLESFDRTAGELEELRRLKSRFYSMVAHDLRAPLSTLILAVHSLQSAAQAGQPVDGRLTAIVSRKADELRKLVNTLLDAFFIESGKVDVLLQQVDANELLQRCAEGQALHASERHQEVVVKPLEGDARLLCDPTKVSQVLDNLVGNAIKYSHVEDTIELAAIEAGPDLVRFSVADHGPGIAAEEIQKIFEPYHRASSMRGRTEGLGLGLAICKEFVKAHGGELWVESSPGEGSRFFFTIPRGRVG